MSVGWGLGKEFISKNILNSALGPGLLTEGCVISSALSGLSNRVPSDSLRLLEQFYVLWALY